MNMTRMTIAEFMYQCRLRIVNSIEDQNIQQATVQLGYTPERLEEGRALLDASTALCERYDKEYGEVTAAFDQRNKEKEAADEQFKIYLTVAKVALKNNQAALTTLQLNQRMPRTFSGWLNKTRGFYNNLLNNPEWMTEMAKFNTTEAQLKQGLDTVKKVEGFAEVIMREKGDAQNATKERDAKLEELNEWINDYESIAKIALMAQPQLLEKLGIVVK